MRLAVARHLPTRATLHRHPLAVRDHNEEHRLAPDRDQRVVDGLDRCAAKMADFLARVFPVTGPIIQCYASTYPRAYQTAQLTTCVMPYRVDLQIDRRLDKRTQRAWYDGRKNRIILIDELINNKMDGEENYHDVNERLSAFIADCRANVAAFTHSGPCLAFRHLLCGMTLEEVVFLYETHAVNPGAVDVYERFGCAPWKLIEQFPGLPLADH